MLTQNAPRKSRTGLRIMGLGGALLAAILTIFVLMEIAPNVVPHQPWLGLLPLATKTALGLLVLGLVLYVLEFTAHRIAALSAQDEEAGKSPLRGWLMSSAFGLGVLYLAYRVTLGSSLFSGTSQVRRFEPNTWGSEDLWGNAVLAIPVIVMLGFIALGGIRAAKGQPTAQPVATSWGRALLLNVVIVAAIFGCYAMFVISQP